MIEGVIGSEGISLAIGTKERGSSIQLSTRGLMRVPAKFIKEFFVHGQIRFRIGFLMDLRGGTWIVVPRG